MLVRSTFSWMLVFVTCLGFFAQSTFAMESDPWGDRGLLPQDIAPWMGRHFNRVLGVALAGWNESLLRDGRLPIPLPGEKGHRYRKALACRDCSRSFLFTTYFADHLAGPDFNGTLEMELNQLPQDYRLSLGDRSIYSAGSFFAVKGLWFAHFGWAPWSAEQLNYRGIRIGVDKWDHFVSEGYKYFALLERYQWDLDRVLAEGAKWEAGFYGLGMSGVFSNADLVANFEGLRFYQNLFEPVGASGPLLRMQQTGTVERLGSIQLDSFIHPFMDEGVPPSSFDPLLWREIAPRLQELCNQRGIQGELGSEVSWDSIRAKYPRIPFQFRTDQTIQAVCKRVEVQ